jgi:hypothetical protein
LAITTALTLRAVFGLALRQTEGLIASLLRLLGLDLAAPDHSTISRRGETLPVSRPRPGSQPVHLLVDSTGLKLCGPGDWLVEKHATRTRRAWRKLHIGVDADTGQIIAAELTSKDVDDGSQVSPLLEQIAGPVAYRRWSVRSGRCLQCGLPASPGCGGHCAATFKRGAKRRGRDRADGERPTPEADRRARPHGLAAGIWLQSVCLGGGRYRPLQASDL